MIWNILLTQRSMLHDLFTIEVNGKMQEGLNISASNCIMVIPGAIWSFHVLTGVPWSTQNGAWKYFFLREQLFLLEISIFTSKCVSQNPAHLNVIFFTLHLHFLVNLLCSYHLFKNWSLSGHEQIHMVMNGICGCCKRVHWPPFNDINWCKLKEHWKGILHK